MTAPVFSESDMEKGRKLFVHPALFILGATCLDQLPQDDRPEIAFAGRSNVGKSSLINALLNRKNFARISAEPGKTRELNYFDIASGRLWLVDLPGFGYARVAKNQVRKWMQLTRAYLQGRANLRRVFLLIDIRRGLSVNDRAIMTLLDSAAVNYQIVLTKADKAKTCDIIPAREALATKLAKHPAAHPVIHVTSAQKGGGIAQLRAEISHLARVQSHSANTKTKL